MKLLFYEKKILISKRKFKIGSVTVPNICPSLIFRAGRTHLKELEEKVRDLNRVVATIQPASEEIEAIEAEIEAEIQDELEPPKEKRWIAFAPTSYHQLRVGAELKFTRGRHVMTGVVKWIGQRPQGSNKTFIGVEAAEDVMDPDSCGDLWEGGNSSRSILLTMDKIIVAWDWDSIISKL